MPCSPNDLAEVDLFKLLDENELAELASVIDSKTVVGGQIIFNAGELGDSLYIVRSGEVELFVKDTAGQKIVLTTAEPNDLFGELSMLDERPRSATRWRLRIPSYCCLIARTCCCFFKNSPMLRSICWPR